MDPRYACYSLSISIVTCIMGSNKNQENSNKNQENNSLRNGFCKVCYQSRSSLLSSSLELFSLRSRNDRILITTSIGSYKDKKQESYDS